MIEFDLARYVPGDTLHLWWLADPAQPRPVGEVRIARTMQGVSLTYGPAWLASGFALSEDLPLKPGEFLPRERHAAAGAVDDARPDRWGERVIRLLDRPPRLSVLDYLFFAGDERFGALGVSVEAGRYVARASDPLPRLADVQEMQRLVDQLQRGEAVPEDRRRLITPGATLGGARPKALLELDGQPCVLKFGEADDVVDMPIVEHASMTLAAQAGIRVAATRALALPGNHALAVQRFDRMAGTRRHALSAHVALRAAAEEPGYPALAQWLRRRGETAGDRHLAQMHELFRRMVFNILIDNTDDHEKNHALLMTPGGAYELSPAFDVVPAAQSLGYQQMRVGADGTDATLDNALSECRQFGLERAAAIDEVRRVCDVVAGWQAHFRRAGVGERDVAELARHIDRPALKAQREAFRGSSLKRR